MDEKKKVKIVNIITGSRIAGTILIPIISSIFEPLGTAIYIGTLWSTDFIDGFLARKWEVSTIFGANLDAFSDKLLGMGNLLYLSFFYPIMLISLILEIAIFKTNWNAGKKGADVKSSKIGKIKTGILAGTTALSVLSTISIANVLTRFIPLLSVSTIIFQTITLSDYKVKNKKYLKEHNSKNDKSNLGFIETIKEIIRLLKNPDLYNPSYFKEHQNEPLLDKLYNNKTNNLESIHLKQKNEKITFAEKENLRKTFSLNDHQIQEIEQQLFINQNMSIEKIYDYLFAHSELYLNDKKIYDEYTPVTIEKQKSLKKK